METIKCKCGAKFSPHAEENQAGFAVCPACSHLIDLSEPDNRLVRRTRYGDLVDDEGNVWVLSEGIMDPDEYAAYIRECAAQEPWDFLDISWDD